MNRMIPTIFLRLCSVALLSLFCVAAYAAAPSGVWWDSTYAYRQNISVQAGPAALVTSYAVSFTIDHSTLRANGQSLISGNDMRIVYWNGSGWTELDRIADPDNTWNTAGTKIWFRTQAALTTGTTSTDYYLYYGNASAGTPPTTTTNIFSFYDDFSSATLDTTTRWTNNGSTQSGSVLTVGNGAQIRSQSTFGIDTIWETSAALSSTLAPSGTAFYYWAANSSNNYNYSAPYLRFFANTTNHSAQDSAATTTNFTPTTPTSYQTYAFTREGTTTARFLVNGTQVASFTHAANSTALRILLRNDTAAGQTQQYAWARVRVYRNPEPAVSLSNAEQLLTASAVAEWRLDQASWTGAAGEVIDSGTNGLNGRAFGSATTANTTPAVTGDPGTCRYGNFNGTSQYVEVADNALLDLTNQLTVTVWVYPRAYGTELKSIVSKDTNYEFHLDDSGQVYWWWNDSGGTTRSFTTTGYSAPLNQWTHIAITYQSGTQRIYINGVQRASQTYTGTLITNNYALQIGYDGASSAQTGRYWNGLIDEVRVYGVALTSGQVNTVMNTNHPCSAAHHFTITHDRYGINCAAENIQVAVRDSTNNNVSTYTQTVTLDTGTGKGDWSLVTGTGTLNNGTANDGIATYQWASGTATATFALSYREGATPINISVYQSNLPSVIDDDTEGTMAWSPNGFTVTSSLLSNPPPGVIPAFASPQVAATAFTVYITAYGVTPNDSQCGVIEAYTGAKNLKFWSTYANPTTGTMFVSINGTNIVTTEGSAANRSITFTNGQASVTALYGDVGLMNIAMKDDSSADPNLVSLNGIRGSTGNIVVRPATFTVTANSIRRTSDSFLNPAASNAGGSAFIAAGQPFTATVTAYGSTGVATPNFGKESPAESVAFTSNLILPSGGQNPAVTSTNGFATFNSGASTGTDFVWPEVGIITLTPHIKDSDYLGAGDVVGTTTGNVGRFIPANFGTALNVPSFQTACSTGSFTYMGQPLNYVTAPVITVTARAVGGTTTRNYTGNFFKLTNTTLTNRTYTAASGTLDTTGVPAVTSDPTILDLTNGLASLTFSSGTGLSFAHTTPVAPFNAQISLGINVIDSDGVAATNPVSFSNIAFSNGSEQRYGRIAFRNAVGSELLNLPLPMRAEYFVNNASGFAINGADSCTTGVTLSFTSYGGNLASGETCLLDTGAPGVSGLGCSVAGAPAERFRMAPVAGDFVANLRAPGAGNDGTVTLTTVVPVWLRFDWNAAVVGQENPSGVATFGLFKGDAKRIFQSEK